MYTYTGKELHVILITLKNIYEKELKPLLRIKIITIITNTQTNTRVRHVKSLLFSLSLSQTQTIYRLLSTQCYGGVRRRKKCE